jgi:hypothetical protein
VVGTGAVIGILALLFCLWQSGLLAGRSELPAPVLMKREQAAPPALGKVGLAMPDDISNWLKHLERIENEKHALLDKEIANMKVFEQMIGAVGAGINEVDPYDQDSDPNSGNPGSITKGKFEDLRPEWAKLLTDFESVPPPAECQQIANNYQTGLEAVPNMIGEVNNVLNQVGTDPSMALKNMQEMQNKSYGEVDKPFANADQEVQDICDKYQTAKWFKIGDVGGNFFGGF